ncbi:MAG: hypothetical protein IPJ67_02170 [Candidatus Moraniibacteriota bacterium]|nr:MAG: hypothetical protein IPJ67_02170 [Candidatus Moranbacteria bacterium]
MTPIRAEQSAGNARYHREQVLVTVYLLKEGNKRVGESVSDNEIRRLSQYIHTSRLAISGVETDTVDFRIDYYKDYVAGSIFYQIVKGQSPNGILLLILPKDTSRETSSAIASSLRDMEISSAWAVCVPQYIAQIGLCSGCSLQRRCTQDVNHPESVTCPAPHYHSLMPARELKFHISRRGEMLRDKNHLPVAF